MYCVFLLDYVKRKSQSSIRIYIKWRKILIILTHERIIGHIPLSLCHTNSQTDIPDEENLWHIFIYAFIRKERTKKRNRDKTGYPNLVLGRSIRLLNNIPQSYKNKRWKIVSIFTKVKKKISCRNTEERHATKPNTDIYISVYYQNR